MRRQRASYPDSALTFRRENNKNEIFTVHLLQPMHCAFVFACLFGFVCIPRMFGRVKKKVGGDDESCCLCCLRRFDDSFLPLD